MLWNGLARREKGVLRAAHTYTANIRECPPPPRVSSTAVIKCVSHERAFNTETMLDIGEYVMGIKVAHYGAMKYVLQ